MVIARDLLGAREGLTAKLASLPALLSFRTRRRSTTLSFRLRVRCHHSPRAIIMIRTIPASLLSLKLRTLILKKLLEISPHIYLTRLPRGPFPAFVLGSGPTNPSPSTDHPMQLKIPQRTAPGKGRPTYYMSVRKLRWLVMTIAKI